jgi:hypothetical protein
VVALLSLRGHGYDRQTAKPSHPERSDP